MGERVRHGRGKVVLKLIEDKSSRKVTFSKRRRGLMKKAHELAVLCDVEVGVVIYSCTGRPYHFSSTNCIESTIKRYEDAVKSCKGINTEILREYQGEHPIVGGKDKLDATERFFRNLKIEELNACELTQLEQQLHATLRHIINWKNHLVAQSTIRLHKVASRIQKESNPPQMPQRGVADGGAPSWLLPGPPPFADT